MSSLPSDRNLHFGIVAMRMNLISRVELLAASREWVNDKTRTFRQVLLAQNALACNEITLIDAQVELHHMSNTAATRSSLANGCWWQSSGRDG